MISRRHAVAMLASAAAYGQGQNAGKPMRGIFCIMATPYTASKQIDFEDLAGEVSYLDKAGVHGMVWPQIASEFSHLSKEERLEGMSVIAKAARGKRPALVLGVQGPNIAVALEYAAHAEKLQPDAMIAMPPSEAKSLEDYRSYYKALAGVTKRPIFMQTTGGAKSVVPDVKFLVDMAREYPNYGYVKEEFAPVVERMNQMNRQRPPIKALFSGFAGKGMMYEMRLGFDGTMPGSHLADVYARIWNLYQSGKRDEARDVFAKLLLLINLDQEIPGTRQYVMKARGVFKTTVSRQVRAELTPAAIEEIEFSLKALRPYFVA
jgi:4-hydroxy-tetrahydrodipicolinate synthase